MTLKIFCDDNHEGNWFKSLSPLLSNVALIQIQSRGQNAPNIEKLLRYDRPDIVLVEDDVPKLVLEKTREVPTGHNVGQRFGRLVNAAEEGIMVIFFIPFKARKHGRYSSVCHIPARFFLALQKMEVIHQIPVLAINWPVDSSHELITDNSENALLGELISELILNRFDYSKSNKICEIRGLMTEGVKSCMKTTSDSPASARIVNTAEYFSMLKEAFPSDFMLTSSVIRNRPLSLIYKIGMTEEKCKRTDPYTGTQFIYDYLACRNGPRPSDKHSNLILSMPFVSKSVWTQANPNAYSLKSALWYATADLMVLKDGIIPCATTFVKK